MWRTELLIMKSCVWSKYKVHFFSTPLNICMSVKDNIDWIRGESILTVSRKSIIIVRLVKFIYFNICTTTRDLVT